MKRLILFGAGENGRRALEFWGEDKVECFVDNDEQKVGNNYCGKRIISFSELCRIWKQYEVMITANSYCEIADQLKRAGIVNFSKFVIPDVNRVISYLQRVSCNKNSQIALYGSDEYTIALLNSLPMDIKCKIGYILDDRNENNRFDCIGYRIYQIHEVTQNFGAVLITSPKFHIADEIHLQRRVKKHIDILNPYRLENYFPTDQLVINKYLNENNEAKSEKQLNEKNHNRTDYFKAVRAYVEEVKEDTPLFKLVEIETVNRCNGVCEFCPVNVKDDPREKHVMSNEMFYNIIRQLEALEYQGRISLFSNNEPFLDERILDFSVYMRKHLPRAKIHMFTNGTLLTLDKFKKVIPCLDELILDNYTQDLHLIKPAQEIEAYCEEHPELIKKVSIVLRKPKEFLSSRGGTAPNRKIKEQYPEIPCAFPFQQLIIRPTGEISLCCNDALGKYTLGDLKKESILEVWYGDKYKAVREAIVHGRKSIEICQSCDTFSLYL